MGSSSSQPTTVVTTQNKDPWGPAQPHLQGIYGQAANLYGSGIGYQPYTGARVSPYTIDQANAIGGMRSMAYNEPNGTSGVNAARGLAENLINSQGMNAGTTQTANQFSNIYNDASGQQNPYLLAQIAANDRRIADKVNSAMSGAGRYGSGAHTDVLARSLAEAANPVLAQDYAQRQQTRLAATGGLGNVYDTALNRAGQWSQVIPGLDEARFANLDRIFATGDWERGVNQQNLNAQMQLYNEQQAYPWEQLGRYAATIGGAGNLGGSMTTSQPVQQPSSLQRIFGGAAAGAGLGSMFGPWGAGIGGVGGGLLGMMG